MRKSFIDTLTEIAAKDDRIVLLTADLGFKVMDSFIEKFPDRFINVGVSEQNMIGVATGLAEAGFIPFVYSMVPFALLRSYEFIKCGPVLHKLPVRIIGVGGGCEYGLNGQTHYGLEDLALTRVQPDLVSIIPADCRQIKQSLEKVYDCPKPIYFRVSKMNYQDITKDENFTPGKLSYLNEDSSDTLIITLGSLSQEVLKTKEELFNKGIKADIAVVSTLNPSPIEDIKLALGKYKKIITVEDHYLNGGIGSMVAEITADYGISSDICRIGVDFMPVGRYGSMDFLLQKVGLKSTQITKKILDFYNDK